MGLTGGLEASLFTTGPRGHFLVDRQMHLMISTYTFAVGTKYCPVNLSSVAPTY